MERIDLYVKSAAGIIAGYFSILTETFGVPITILIIFMFADFVSGIIASMYTGEKFKSSRGTKGLLNWIGRNIILRLKRCIGRCNFRSFHCH